MIEFNKLMIVGSVFAMLGLAACGGGGGGDDGGGGGGGGGGSGSGVNREIDLSAADDPYPLAAPDDVAKIAYVLSGVSDLLLQLANTTIEQSSTRKETETCDGGGELTYDVDQTPPSISATVDFDACASENTLADGHLDMNCSYNLSNERCNPLELIVGEGTTSLMFEVLAPAAAEQRVLVFGSAGGVADIDFNTQTFHSMDMGLRLMFAVEELDGSHRRSVDLTDYDIEITAVETGYSVDQAGIFLVDGACGTGQAMVETVAPMRVDGSSETVVAGELEISHESGSDHATIVFNPEGTVTVTADNGMEETYTEEQLAALCAGEAA